MLSPRAVRGLDHGGLACTRYGSISELLSITSCLYALLEKLESEIPTWRQAHGEYRRVSGLHMVHNQESTYAQHKYPNVDLV